MLRAVCLTGALLSVSAVAQVRVNVNVDLGTYFHRPAQEMVVLERSRIPDEDMPVVLFISERAHVPPAEIWSYRQRGMRWCDIGLRFGVGADVYHVPLAVDPGPVYGHAYGYYRRVPPGQWRTIRLEDSDIVNLVNLRFYSEHYGYAPERIVAWRGNGGNFVRIHEVAEREHWRGRPAYKEWRKAEHEAYKQERKEEKEDRKEWKKSHRGRGWQDR